METPCTACGRVTGSTIGVYIAEDIMSAEKDNDPEILDGDSDEAFASSVESEAQEQEGPKR